MIAWCCGYCYGEELSRAWRPDFTCKDCGNALRFREAH